MSTPNPLETNNNQLFKDTRHLSYDDYAFHYDEMCELLPVYQDNVDYLIDQLPHLDLPDKPRICDLGAGTGNFIVALAKALPEATFVHVDMNENMNARAAEKYENEALKRVEIVNEYIERVDFSEREFDLVISVNALNTAAPQLPILKKVKQWLKPNASLFLIDFGRRQRVLDWGWYIFTNALRTGDVKKYFRALLNNREAIRQNRLAAKDQLNGLMWTHTLSEFKELIQKAGFDVRIAKTCYRGYCDLVIADIPDSSIREVSVEHITQQRDG